MLGEKEGPDQISQNSGVLFIYLFILSLFMMETYTLHLMSLLEPYIQEGKQNCVGVVSLDTSPWCVNAGIEDLFRPLGECHNNSLAGLLGFAPHVPQAVGVSSLF